MPTEANLQAMRKRLGELEDITSSNRISMKKRMIELTGKPIKLEDSESYWEDFVANAQASGESLFNAFKGVVESPIDNLLVPGAKIAAGGILGASRSLPQRIMPEMIEGRSALTAQADELTAIQAERAANPIDTTFEDPFGVAADLFPASKPARAAMQVTKLGKLAPLVKNPGEIAVDVASGGTKLAAKGTSAATREVSAFLSGADPQSISTARRVNVGPDATPQSRQVFRDTQVGTIGPDEIRSRVANVIGALKKQRRQAFNEGMSQLDPVNKQFSLQVFRDTILPEVAEIFSEFGIKIKKGQLDFSQAGGFKSPKNQNKIKKAWRLINEYQANPRKRKFKRTDPIEGIEVVTEQLPERFGNIKTLNSLKHDLDELMSYTRKRTRADAVMAQLRSSVDDLLRQDNMGGEAYSRIMREYSDNTHFLDKLGQAVNIKAADDTMVRRIAGSIRESSRHREAVLKQAQKKAGEGDIDAIAAGLELEELGSKSLVGRSQLSSMLSIAGGFALDPTFFLLFPLSSPKIVGRALHAAGMGQQKIQPFLNVLERLNGNGRARELSQAGLNIGEILERLDEEGELDNMKVHKGLTHGQVLNLSNLRR